jgi:AAA+ ATPase superfamily predicted ATPase
MVRDPDLIVNRQRELERLRQLLQRGEPQLALMYGRRRVGKTHLLSRAWDGPRAFYFTASETTPDQNRLALLNAFREWSGESVHAEDYPTWRTVFRLLLDHASPEPLVVTIDEFQYLANDRAGLNAVASELNAAWEARRPARPLVFVLSGSAVGALEQLNDGGSPLYGRFAWQCQLRPFNYWYAGELAGFEHARDRAYAYGLFGGTPRYLAAIDPERSVEDNASDLLLRPDGEVRELVQTALLQEQGLREIPKYIAILRAIGRGRTELNEIASGTGMSPDNSLRDKLNRLIALDYITASRNLGAKPKEAYRYRVADPAFRFYYDFVAPLESALETQNPKAVWEAHIGPRLDTYMGLVFETLVEQAYYRLQPHLDLPIVREWGRWEGRDRSRRPVEVDVASMLMDGRVLSGAVKWNRTEVDVAVHHDHLAMLDRLAESGVKWAHEAKKSDSPLLYVASGGFTSRFRQAALASRDEVYLWDLSDLYGSH